jgi:D-sedoheptulose 7-phosphate isomerase
MKGFYLARPLSAEAKQSIRAKTMDSAPDTADKLQCALPAIALSEHSALISAFANDVDADLVYAQQVIGYGRPGDALLCISTSGNARNVLLAAQVASARGLVTIALTGGSGGPLAKACDVSIIAPGDQPAEVQELHLPIYHALCAMLEASFFGS